MDTGLEKMETMSQLQVVKNRLFGKDGLNVKNVKMFNGTSETTSEQMSHEINRALSQIEDGQAQEVVDEE